MSVAGPLQIDEPWPSNFNIFGVPLLFVLVFRTDRLMIFVGGAYRAYE